MLLKLALFWKWHLKGADAWAICVGRFQRKQVAEMKWEPFEGQDEGTGWGCFVCEERESGSLKLQSNKGEFYCVHVLFGFFGGWSWGLGLQFVNHAHDRTWSHSFQVSGFVNSADCTTDVKQMCLFFHYLQSEEEIKRRLHAARNALGTRRIKMNPRL